MHQTNDIISLSVHQRGLEPQTLHGATFNEDLESLLDEIGQGLRADDATNFEKLTIARKYGPLLIELKEMVPHGHFKLVLKERFPRVSYAKCNRWMVIARHESKVAEALVAYPDVTWGPKRMIDLLQGRWSPEVECDEDECYGVTPDNRIAPDDEPYYDEIEEENQDETDDSDAADPDDSESNQALLSVTASSKSREFAQKAKREAESIDQEPEVSPQLGKVVVTVFTTADHSAIQECLARWEPKSITLKGSKQTTVTIGLPPNDVPHLFDLLSKTLKRSLPSHLNVSVEL